MLNIETNYHIKALLCIELCRYFKTAVPKGRVRTTILLWYKYPITIFLEKSIFMPK